MLSHALKCPELLSMDKHFLRSAYNVPVPSEAPAAIPPNERADCAQDTPPFSQDTFEMLLARVLFCCALPFALIDDPTFRILFTMMVLMFRLPSRARLAGHLLVKVKEECKAEVIQTINRQRTVSIVTDGWTDVNGSSIVNFMVVAPGMKSIFWSSLATGTDQHTAQFMAAELERVINEVQHETTAVVAGVLTDNAPSMSAAWGLLEQKLPVFGGGCAGHVLNLLMADIFKKIPFMKIVKDEALAITRFVREHHGVLDQFRHLQRTQLPADQERHALVLPVATRWYTAHACLRILLYNRSIVENLFMSSRHSRLLGRYKTPASVHANLLQVKATVCSERVWQNLAYAVAMLDPIILTLLELESDNVPTSRVYERFKWLHQGYSAPSPLNNGGAALFGEMIGARQDAHDPDFRNISRSIRKRARVEFRRLVDNRWKFAHTNAMGIAYLLDPNTNPSEFIDNDEADSIAEACKFASRTGMLDRLGVTHEQLNGWLYAFAFENRGWTEPDKRRNAGVFPRQWLESRQNADEKYMALSQLADLVISIPTSSARSERAWSIFDYIHTKKRNRLSTMKVEMLAYVCINSPKKTKQTSNKILLCCKRTQKLMSTMSRLATTKRCLFCSSYSRISAKT